MTDFARIKTLWTFDPSKSRFSCGNAHLIERPGHSCLRQKISARTVLAPTLLQPLPWLARMDYIDDLIQLYIFNNLIRWQLTILCMTRAVIKAKRVGGSIMVRIPKEVVDQEDIREGDMIEVEVSKAKRSYFGTTPGIGPFTREDKMRDHD